MSSTPTGERNDDKELVRRSKLEIRMDILSSVMGGAERPTPIMYKANLSWVLLSKELTLLTSLGFLEVKDDGNRKTYSITSKGIDLVRSYENIVRELDRERRF